MSNLLLEFTKKDETELLQDQDIFTISYEIELDTDDLSVWGYDTDLRIYISDREISDIADELFYSQDVSEFYDHIGSSPSIGGAFVRWVSDTSTSAQDSYGIMIRVANGLGLLGENIDEDLLKDLTEGTLYYAISDLHSGENKEAKIALAKNIMSNIDLKNLIEDKLKISLPDQIDMIEEDSRLEVIVDLIFEAIPDRSARRQFIKNLFINSFDKVSEEKRNYSINYVNYLRDYIEETNKLEPASIDQTEEEQERIENLNDIYDLILDNAVIEEIFKQIPQEINNNADDPTSMDEFDSYNMYADGIPADIESDFEEWIQSEFETFKEESKNELYYKVENSLETYFNIDDYINFEPDEETIEDVVKWAFPNFYKNWGDILTFELDGSLKYGFEMSPTTYLTSINEAFEFLKDFYKDYEKQSEFKFNYKTGLHTNIGIVNGNQDNWNYFKGFLFLNDNFATRGFEERLYNKYSGSIRNAIMNKIRSDDRYVDKTSFRNAVIGAVESNFDAIESAMNRELESASTKRIGFSIRDNRIEFRYPGGDLDIESLKDATLYYAYVVKLITDPQFKRREYLKKATAFVLGMGDDLDRTDRKDTNFKNANRALLIIKEAINSNPNPEPLFKISKDARIQGLSFLSSIDNFLNPNFLSSLSITNYTRLDRAVAGGFDNSNYVRINAINNNSKTVNITDYFVTIDSEKIIPNVKFMTTFFSVGNFFIGEKEVNTSIYNFAQAIVSKQIVPVTTEEYAKIKLLSDPDKSLQYLERSIPWMQGVLTIRDILEDAGVKDNYTIDYGDLNDILDSGNFDDLMSKINDFKNN